MNADVDGDLDVDQADFAVLQACFTGDSGAGYDLEKCHCLDSNDDKKITETDIVAFEACASGPGIQANPSCP